MPRFQLGVTMLLKSIILTLSLVFSLSSLAQSSELHPSLDLESCIKQAIIEADRDSDTYELDEDEARTFCESYID